MADSGDKIILGDRFELKPASRLAQFDRGTAQAFAADDLSHPGRKLFALIASGTLPCRALDLPDRRGKSPLLWPEATGMVDWPVRMEDGAPVWGRRPALVYAQPGGAPMAKSDDDPLPKLNEQTIARTILKPAVDMLRELEALDLPHRAIRPTNIFYASGDSGEIVFGDCLAAIPGADQPTVYETAENGLANRMGRSGESRADDFYALGVLVLAMYMGRRPMQGMSDEAIIAAKINFGSFSALSQGEKFSPALAELLRGLLSDKVADRWILRNLEMWMLGQYFNPVLPGLPQRATRPIRFGGNDHISKPALAHAMAWHWDEATEFVADGALESWLGRGFNDDKVAEPLSIIRGLASSYGAPTGVKHRTVSRMIAFMGPALPICYRAIRVNIEALGNMLASVIDQPPLRNEFAELMRARLPHGWLEQQAKQTPDVAALRRVLDKVDPLIERPGPGFVLERALYELAPTAPCRSELVGDFCVTQLRDLLPAIDAALPGAAAGTLPMDRHIAAFIAARLGRNVERDLGALANMAEQVPYRLSVLRLIAAVQAVHPTRDLPRLGETVAAMLAPVVESFHRLASRDALHDRVKLLGANSDFQQLAEMLDAEGITRQIDEQGYLQAQQTFAALEKEAQWLESGGLSAPAIINASARVNAAVTSAFLASVVIAGFAVMMAV
jgi:eukaryotic-like serine/threonine-protein kinase